MGVSGPLQFLCTPLGPPAMPLHPGHSHTQASAGTRAALTWGQGMPLACAYMRVRDKYMWY